MNEKTQTASDMLDIAVRMQQRSVQMPMGRERRVLLRAAQIMRLASELVVDGRWSIEVGRAYVDAGRLTMAGIDA